MEYYETGSLEPMKTCGYEEELWRRAGQKGKRNDAVLQEIE